MAGRAGTVVPTATARAASGAAPTGPPLAARVEQLFEAIHRRDEPPQTSAAVAAALTAAGVTPPIAPGQDMGGLTHSR